MSEGDEDHPLGAGLSSLIRLSGINVPARARFVGEAMVSATLSSVTLGLCCGGMIGSTFPVAIGPLIPFLMGSMTGYGFGLWQYWSGAKQTTLWYAQQYPTLLVHALRTDRQIIVPASVRCAQDSTKTRQSTTQIQIDTTDNEEKYAQEGPTLDQWILQGGLGRLTWSILAAQQCRADVRAIQQQERQRLVEHFANSSDDVEDK